MYTYIYAECLDKADEIKTEIVTGLNWVAAKEKFNTEVRKLVAALLDNPYLRGKMDIHMKKAFFTIEGTRHIIEVKEEELHDSGISTEGESK